ncbi:MAG: hypothetical protein ACW98F_14930 [Candidatus Hodarchaeales archaeon]|jgi:hypothetical protein
MKDIIFRSVWLIFLIKAEKNVIIMLIFSSCCFLSYSTHGKAIPQSVIDTTTADSTTATQGEISFLAPISGLLSLVAPMLVRRRITKSS